MGLVLFCRHSSHLRHLEAEIEFWRMEFAHERQRAERAIDTLLSLPGRPPVHAITVPTPEERARWDPERMVKDPEFTLAGMEPDG